MSPELEKGIHKGIQRRRCGVGFGQVLHDYSWLQGRRSLV